MRSGPKKKASKLWPLQNLAQFLWRELEREKRVGIYPASFVPLRKQPKVCSGNSYVLLIDLNHAVGGKQKRKKTDFFPKGHGWVSLSHCCSRIGCQKRLPSISLQGPDSDPVLPGSRTAPTFTLGCIMPPSLF